MADDEVAGQQAHRLGLRGHLRGVGDADAHLTGERGDEVLLGDDALAHEDLSEAAAVGALVQERLVEQLLVDKAAGDEEGAELEAAGAALLAAGAGRLEPGVELLGAERFGDELRRPQAVRLLERVEVAARRENDQRRGAQLGAAADETHELEGVEGLEVEVEHDARR